MSDLLAAIPRAQGQGWAITEDGRRWLRRGGFGGDVPFFVHYAPGKGRGIYRDSKNRIDGSPVVAEGDGKPEWCPQ